MHTLYFILNFKAIVFSKIDYRDNNVIWKGFKAIAKLLVMPPCNKVMTHKILQLWLQVLHQLTRIGGLIDEFKFFSFLHLFLCDYLLHIKVFLTLEEIWK